MNPFIYEWFACCFQAELMEKSWETNPERLVQVLKVNQGFVWVLMVSHSVDKGNQNVVYVVKVSQNVV